jgi:hypothetical protein
MVLLTLLGKFRFEGSQTLSEICDGVEPAELRPNSVEMSDEFAAQGIKATAHFTPNRLEILAHTLFKTGYALFQPVKARFNVREALADTL